MRLIGHHLISDLTTMVKAGYPVPDADFFDTEVAARWLFPDTVDFTLEHLALRMTNMGQWRNGIGKLTADDFDQMSDDELAQRCGGDSEGTVKLSERLEPEIHALGLDRVWALAMSVLPILAVVGGTGMAVDTSTLADRAKKSDQWLGKEKKDLERTLGIQNLNSHVQLAEALYGPRFEAETLRKTKKGYSTDRTSLLWARHQAREQKTARLDTLLSRILDYGAKKKLHSTYYGGWLDQIGQNGHIHSYYSLGNTATGRLSSYNVNLQNVPDVVRELIHPSEGYDRIVSADYKQLELCGAAHISNDPVMQRWIRERKDIHAITAARVLGYPEPKTQEDFARFKEEHDVERATGKLANFAILYGIQAESLTWKIFLDTNGEVYVNVDQAQQYINTFFETFTGYNRHITDLWYALQRRQWITSPFGRCWKLPADPHGWRKAQNYPVQSLASDLTLLALRSLFQELQRGHWKSRIIGEVHDSLVFETTTQEFPALVQLIRQVCEHPDTRPFGFTLSVPLTMEIQSGETWADLTPVELVA